MQRDCCICGNGTVKKQTVYDDRYGYPGEFTLLRCPNCGHAFLDCDMTPSQLGELYTNYYPRKTFNLAQYKPHAEKSGLGAWFNGLNSSAFRGVPKNVRVLDVGCGFGQSLGYHAARGCDVYGVEADENIRRVADKFGFKVHVGLFDDNIYEAEFFDYVTMDQVIEHVTDPLSTLRGVARILKPGGTAILSTPNASGWGAKIFGRRWINWHAPYHVQFFSRRSMQLAAEQSGLVVTKVKTITNSEWLYYQWIHLVLYPKPGEPSRFWSSNHHGRTLLEWRILRALGLMHRIKINHFITRFFDSLGLGDNYVFVLKKP
jgi:2-polyprenyl-3-methyl-5-hydroxy-6-metoxy-1,4-benzoquinol methylase